MLPVKNCVIVGFVASCLLLVPGCTAPVVNNFIDLGCVSFQAIHPTASDVDTMSQDLVDQILSHNRTWEERCLPIRAPSKEKPAE